MFFSSVYTFDGFFAETGEIKEESQRCGEFRCGMILSESRFVMLTPGECARTSLVRVRRPSTMKNYEEKTVRMSDL